ncbi:hypothetical protein ACFFRE_04085 [Aciditerrimonas ferrireducens]|uniref:Glycosyltransferase RgtA/B/C/D-like domain-containing protein n=1 Tax=Aciditerrimonas ferrireducens TaxID=667306 RepID=A0ABV6C0X1_9ACTN
MALQAPAPPRPSVVPPRSADRDRWWLMALGVATLGISLLWWRGVWGADPASTALCACGDPGLYLWFFAAPAHALAAGHLPFLVHSAWAPAGINLLDNASTLALAVLFAPLTLTAGPVAAVNTCLLLTPPATALCTYPFLRRVVRPLPAALGSLFYGCSPLVFSGSKYVHLDVVFLALPPLVGLLLLQLLADRHRSPWRVGVWLGLVLVVQFFVSTEQLALTVLAAALGLALAALGAWRRAPALLGPAWRRAWRGLCAAGLLSGALLAYPLWFTVAGPRHVVGKPWSFIATTGNPLLSLVDLGPSAGRVALAPGIFGYLGPAGPPKAYLGPVLVLALVLVVIWLHRDPLVQWAGALLLVLLVLSLGGHLLLAPGPPQGFATSRPVPLQPFLPWTWLARLPLLGEASPGRLVELSDLLVALLGALGLDRLAAHLTLRPWHLAGRALRPGLVLGACALCALGPLAAVTPSAFTVGPVSPPPWFRLQAPRLPARTVALVFPVGLSQPGAWQAMSGMPIRLAVGAGFVPGPDGRADTNPPPDSALGFLEAISLDRRPPWPTPALAERVRAELARHRVGVIVADGEFPDQLAVTLGTMTAVLGTPPELQDDAYVWTPAQLRHLPRPWDLPTRVFERCLPPSDPALSPGPALACLGAAHQASAGHPGRPGGAG